ncbi:MAG TPA: pyridoxine 5'-phosphate oxidase C-terminal domain-containing protein, partial [Salinimicrobium sp.]|nr:pyridoxine 5'-phosphate oxidase C-terminal domain-containing protein [Salinimicrobium sp.]
GAWASQQSSTIPSRAVLEERLKALEKEYEGKPVPKPPFWGGFRVIPEEFEFWQGRPNRLHDRISYKRGSDRDWIKQRLAP